MNNSNTPQPSIILVNPQMGENIGACARAMLNCGLEQMSIINPRDGWPNERATANSAGALEIMPEPAVFASTQEALKPYHYVYATTARPRDMAKPVLTPDAAAKDMHARIQSGQKIAIMFGGERAGLDNDDVALAHAIITAPLNPNFSSLNLAQGVLLIAYEWSKKLDNTAARQLAMRDSEPATHESVYGLVDRLAEELEAHKFFRSPDMKPTLIRNFKNMFSRTEMTDQEVKTLHGAISALTGKKLR